MAAQEAIPIPNPAHSPFSPFAVEDGSIIDIGGSKNEKRTILGGVEKVKEELINFFSSSRQDSEQVPVNEEACDNAVSHYLENSASGDRFVVDLSDGIYSDMSKFYARAFIRKGAEKCIYHLLDVNKQALRKRMKKVREEIGSDEKIDVVGLWGSLTDYEEYVQSSNANIYVPGQE